MQCVHLVGPPGRSPRKEEDGKGLSHTRGSKPLATNVRPTGEEWTVDNHRASKEVTLVQGTYEDAGRVPLGDADDKPRRYRTMRPVIELRRVMRP